MSVDKLKKALGIKGESQRVMNVIERLGNGRVKVYAGGNYEVVLGDYALDTQLIISSGNVIGVVGKSSGTFFY